MKINDDLLIYSTIQSWNQEWEITANINEEGYYTPSLICLNPLCSFTADNDNWIIEELFPNLEILLTYKEATNLTSDIIHKAITFELEELNEISKEDYQTIVDLIEQAIELGFFKEYYGRRKR